MRGDGDVRIPLVDGRGVRQDEGVPPLDPDQCYVAVQRRDERFDGWFVTAVTTTGIYCRPSCPATTPKRSNVDFFPTAAAAQQQGFRACKRCRPDASPGSPEWNVRQDAVGRAMRLIADGVVDREGVVGLARRLGYSERQLNRVVTAELGAGPLAIARAQRAHTARLLVETTAMPITDIAFAAGFGSIRQFNDTIREVFAASPTELRTGARGRRRAPVAGPVAEGSSVTVRLPVRTPFAATEVMRFIGERAIPGLETWDGRTYVRALDLPGGDGVVATVAADNHVAATIAVASWNDLGAAIQRVRRLFDLDADPVAIDAALSRHRGLDALVRAVPGRRAPASVDPFETAVRAVVGQQVSVAGARTVAGRLLAAVGVPVSVGADDRAQPDQPRPVQPRTHQLRRFPRPAELAMASDDAFAMPAARRETIRSLAAAVADGTVELHFGVEPSVARDQLLAVRGIGVWTADYVVMRGLGHPDVFLDADLGVRHALARLNARLDVGSISELSPWRSYAVHHLWASLAQPSPQEDHR